MFNFFAIGNLTKDAESREFDGRFAISISIAINKRVKDKDYVSYLNMTYWSKSEKILPYLKKGKKIAVSGDWYTNNKGKDDKYYQDFSIRELQLLSSNENASNNDKQAPKSNFSTQDNTNNQIEGDNSKYDPFADEEDSDLPF